MEGSSSPEVVTQVEPKTIEDLKTQLGVNKPTEWTFTKGNLALKTVTGFDNGIGIHREALHFLFVSEELRGASLIKKDGSIEEITKDSFFIPIDSNEIEKIKIGEKEFTVKEDSWRNLAFREKEDLEIDQQTEDCLNKVVELWESAIEGGAKFDQFLSTNVDQETLGEIKRAIKFLEIHPIFQQDSTYAEEIDVWKLAEVATRDERLQILKNAYISYTFRESEEFELVNNVANKIRDSKPLDLDDRTLLDAMALSGRLSEKNIHDSENFRITSLNERFVIANAVENFLTRELCPPNTFEIHQQFYSEFAQQLKNSGVEVPDWFSGYRGDEFKFGPAVNSTIANAGGLYFFDSFKETAEIMPGLLCHERIHALHSLAISLGKDRERYEGFRSEETFTEAMSLLIQFKGDPGAVLKSKEIELTSYCQAEKTLFVLLEEINKFSGDKMTSAKLLFRGLAGIASGEISGEFEPIEKYYNENNIGQGEKFAQKMATFSDERRIYSLPSFEDNLENLPKNAMEQKLKEITLEEAQKIDSNITDGVELAKEIKRYIENPLSLLRNWSFGINKLCLDKVLANPDTRTELQGFINEYYQNYLEAIKKRLQEDKQKERKTIVAGEN